MVRTDLRRLPNDHAVLIDITDHVISRARLLDVAQVFTRVPVVDGPHAAR